MFPIAPMASIIHDEFEVDSLREDYIDTQLGYVMFALILYVYATIYALMRVECRI